MIVDLGCGSKKTPGTIGIDVSKFEGVDIVADIEKGIPLKSGSIDKMHCIHFLEHIHNIELLLKEIYRVLKKDGELHATVPYFRLAGAYHWNHKTYWSWYSADSATTNEILGTDYALISRKLVVGSSKTGVLLKIIAKPMHWFVNSFPRLYERFFVPFVPVEELRFVWKKT